MVKWLEHWTANLEVPGSNLAKSKKFFDSFWNEGHFDWLEKCCVYKSAISGLISGLLSDLKRHLNFENLQH